MAVDGTVREFDIMDEPADNDDAEEDAKVADHESELTEDELSDLTFAFQACDLDDAGTIAPDELHAMLSVLGADIDDAGCLALMKEAKQDFKDWLATHEVGTVLPDHMEHSKGKGHGVHGETKHGGERHHHHLAIDRKNRHHPVLSRLHRAHGHPAVKALVAPATYTGKMMSISYELAKKTIPEKTKTDIDELEAEVGEGGVVVMEENALHGLIDSETEMIFAEYVHMMCSTTIQKYTAADWHKSAYQMRLYRNAYDTADVDGDNQLEFRELEMVVMALDPHHSLNHEDMLYLWSVLNPEGLDSLSFNDFLHGMKAVKGDDRCSGWIDINKPNKWEILSLIIDTPVGEVEEKRILSNLSGLERAGINILKKHTQPMDRERMGQVLKRAGDGRLRHLQQSQLDRMKQVHHRCVIVCGLVGFVWTVCPAMVENYLCWALEVDGVKDAYWVCRPHTVPASSPNSTTAYVPAWDPDSTFMQHPELFMCTYRVDNASDCVYPEDWTGYHAGDLDWETLPVVERCSMCACSACMCIPMDDSGEPDHNVMTVWWAVLLVAIIINVVVEILLLMYFAVRYCVQVAWALDYRLIPLNADRAFVADSLVRAAFELGNPDSPVLGVDPHRETSSSNRMRIVVMLLMYKLKVVGTGAVIKAINKRVTPLWFSLFANPVRTRQIPFGDRLADSACFVRCLHAYMLTRVLFARLFVIDSRFSLFALLSVGWHSWRDSILGRFDRACHRAPSGNSRHRSVHFCGAVQRSIGSPLRQLKGYQPARQDPDRSGHRCGYREAREHVPDDGAIASSCHPVPGATREGGSVDARHAR
jgi:hypothetical protein